MAFESLISLVTEVKFVTNRLPLLDFLKFTNSHVLIFIYGNTFN